MTRPTDTKTAGRPARYDRNSGCEVQVRSAVPASPNHRLPVSVVLNRLDVPAVPTLLDNGSLADNRGAELRAGQHLVDKCSCRVPVVCVGDRNEMPVVDESTECPRVALNSNVGPSRGEQTPAARSNSGVHDQSRRYTVDIGVTSGTESHVSRP